MANEPFQRDAQADSESEAQPSGETIDPRYEGATPPGYDWPTHGGYLGCLLAVMFACLLAPLGYIAVGFLGALLSGPLGGLGVAIAIVVTVVAYLAIFVGLVRLGWRMGKRFLREYPQPARQVWGPGDNVVVVDADPTPPRDADAPNVVDADAPQPEDTDGGESGSSVKR